MSAQPGMTVKEVRATRESIAYRTPMKFGGRVVSAATLWHLELDAELSNGKRATGFGSMPLGNVWAWPSTQLSADQTLMAMERLAETISNAGASSMGSGHPLELAHCVTEQLEGWSRRVEQQLGLTEPIPRLAQLVAASPLDAALHDAYGRALHANSYDLLGPDYVPHDLSRWLGKDFRGEYLDRYVLHAPQPRMPLYHLVGALDPLTDHDLHSEGVSRRLHDGLPETLGEWITANGLTHLKIKLNGDLLDWDVDRVAAIERVASEVQPRRGCSRWWYSLDFNERCQNVEYIVEFLARVRTAAPQAWDRIQYIEQPTHRDLRAHPENRMHAASAMKPVVIDESLIDLESLLLCREMGYTGVALKACKGHSEALLMGAAAQKYGLFLCVQDLTCPGFSFLHSASLAARIPTVAAIEGNGRQYCPAGNRGWERLYPSLFQVRDGSVGTEVLNEIGLGFAGTC